VLILELRTLAAEAKQGRLNSIQKKQLYTAVKALHEDGFNWGLTWTMDEAGADLFFAEMQSSSQDEGRRGSQSPASSPRRRR